MELTSSRFAQFILSIVIFYGMITAQAVTRPNVVFFLVDDLGVRDLGCYGSTFHETPTIDRLAREGMQFVNAYASHPVCGPSRAAILTGRFPARLGYTSVKAEVTGNTVWPQRLKEAGYTTFFAGKWHVGSAKSVLENGFDFNVAGHNMGQPGDYYFPYKGTPERFDVPGLEDGQPGDYLTDVLTDKTLSFLDEHGTEPFLLYFSFYNVHKPANPLDYKEGDPHRRAQGKKELTEYFKKKLAATPDSERILQHEAYGARDVEMLIHQGEPEFASQIKAVDESVGRVLAKLDELGVSEHTIVIFTSDQGSMATTERLAVSSALPYRFGKGFNYEGGIRVPLLIKWPGTTKPEARNDTVTVNTDLYPTILEMLNLTPQPEQTLDGISLVKALNGEEIPLNRTLYWAYPYSHGLGHKPSLAVREGPYKLIHWPVDGTVVLYNVEQDPSERTDLSQSHPEIARQLMGKLMAWPAMKAQLDRAVRGKK